LSKIGIHRCDLLNHFLVVCHFYILSKSKIDYLNIVTYIIKQNAKIVNMTRRIYPNL
jgi:hypothetical protein